MTLDPSTAPSPPTEGKEQGERRESATVPKSQKLAVVAVACLAVFVDMLLCGAIIPILPRLLRECGIASEDVEYYMFVMVGSFALGLLVATPAFGVISDRLGNRRIPMLSGLLALATSTLIFAYVRNFALLVVARVAQGISAAATWVIGFAMVADVYSSDDGLGFVTSIIMSVHTIGNFAGPLVGGFLGQYYGLSAPFLLCAGLALLDAIARVLAPAPPPRSPSPGCQQLGMRDLLSDTSILLSLYAILVLASSYCAMEIYLTAWLQDDWNFSESATGLLMLAIIVPNTLMSLVVGWLSDHLSPAKLITAGFVLHGLAAPLIPLAWSLASLIGFACVFGLSLPFINVPVGPHLTGIIERRGGASYARSYALQNMAYSIGMIVGPFAVNVIKVRWGFFVGMLPILLLSLPMAPVFLLCSQRGAPRGSVPIAGKPQDDVLVTGNPQDADDATGAAVV